MGIMKNLLRRLVSPESSSAAIPRAVNVYFRRDRSCALVAPVSLNEVGVYYEQDGVEYLDGQVAADKLGLSFRAAYERFSVRDADLRSLKESDWPAFRASKTRSLKEFKTSFIAVRCHALNKANVSVRASAQHPTLPELELSVTFNPLASPTDIGERLRMLFTAANDA